MSDFIFWFLQIYVAPSLATKLNFISLLLLSSLLKSLFEVLFLSLVRELCDCVEDENLMNKGYRRGSLWNSFIIIKLDYHILKNLPYYSS